MNKKQLIKLPTAKGETLIKPEEIVCVKSSGRTVNVYLDDGTKKEVYFAMGKIEELLEFEYFYTCHRCNIINLLQVRELVNGHSSIILVNNEQIPIARNRKKGLKKALDKICKNGGGKHLIINT